MDESDVDELSNETNEVSENQNDNNSDLSELELGHDENGAYQFEQDGESNLYVARGTCTNSSSGGEIAREETQAEISSLDLRARLENCSLDASEDAELTNDFAPTNSTSTSVVLALASNADEVREEFGIAPKERPAQEQSNAANIDYSKFIDQQILDTENTVEAALIGENEEHEEEDLELEEERRRDEEIEKLLSKAPMPPSFDFSASFPINESDPRVMNSDSQDGQRSSASSLASRSSYISSLASVDSTECFPDRLENCGDKQILIPRYKADNKGYRWPTKSLPLGGNIHFDEGRHAQWITNGLIGGGASGECYAATTIHPSTSTDFCVKKISLRSYNREELLALYLSGKDLYEAKHGRTLSLLSGSENIVHFYGATLCKTNVRIFMKLMQGTVDDYIKKLKIERQSLSKDDYLTYLRDVLSALNFLHGKGILHNDVKAANVLLDTVGLSAKLADFGNATPMDNDPQPRKQDIWSACRFLLEMLDDCRCQTPHFAMPDDVKNLQPHNDNDTNEILNLFRNNDNKILTKLSDILSEYHEYLRTTKVR